MRKCLWLIILVLNYKTDNKILSKLNVGLILLPNLNDN